MSIKVKEVLELAQSKGCTLAAGEGGIDRIVRFVDCMEIPDMKAWMRPNVLYITTGYAYSDTKEEIMNDPNFPEKWKKLLPEEKDDAESIVNAFKEGFKEGKNKGTDS